VIALTTGAALVAKVVFALAPAVMGAAGSILPVRCTREVNCC
jgi:hypothetical protein